MKKFQKIFGVFEKRRIAPRKGGKHHQLSNEKGGENVEPNSREFYKQCAFQKFVIRYCTMKLLQAVKLTCGTYAEPYLYGYSGGGVGK